MSNHRRAYASSFAKIVVVTWIAALANAANGALDDEGMLSFTVRERQPVEGDNGTFRVTHKPVRWDPDKTAAVVCDMWDEHWREGATRRVAEMAPPMNDMLNHLREQGVLIIHAPSGTMDHYEGTLQRERAQAAPPVDTEIPLQGWMHLDPEREAPLPIDDSDGGCDCEPQCEQGSPWSRQIETIDIAEEDAVTDSGEAYYLMRERDIDNVLIMGVHTNMCVLGRPFGIRQMVTQRQNTVLVRDMTDAMYNPRMEPYVPHAAGTDLVVAHIEKYWCPSTTSAYFMDQPAFRFAEDDRPHIVLIASEDEYKAEETLPAFGRKLRDEHHFKISMLHGNPEDRHDVPGMETLYGADAAVLYARRHALKPKQMEALRGYLAVGKPLIALRTSSHAFDTRGDTPENREDWPEFDDEVLGGSYSGHHGADTTTRVDMVPRSGDHALLTDVELPFDSESWLYKASPIADSATPLLQGEVRERQEDPEPVLWTNTYKDSLVVYTSLGHPQDFENDSFNQLLLNAVFHVLGEPPCETP